MDTKGTQTDVKTEETIKPLQEEQLPATTEEQLATLQTAYDELHTKFEQTDKGLRTAQSTLTGKDRQLKDNQDLRGEIDTLKQMMKVVATTRSDNFDDGNQGDIDKKFGELERGLQFRQAQDALSATIDGFQGRVEGLGLKENDDAYLEIQDLVLQGTSTSFKRAELRLSKLENAKKEGLPVDNKPPDEKKRIDDLEKELKRLKQKESGELDSETGIPAGSGEFLFTREQVRNMPDDEYREKRGKIEAAQEAGRIK
mgnify:CR=1 FL=1|tara:strand:- start:467 stop:1234 length:768 start_codon:yes stop_codon:yes gene_type:complete